MLLTARLPAIARILQLLLYLVADAGWLAAWSVALGIWLGPSAAGPLVGLSTIVALLLAALGVTSQVVRRLPRRRNGVLVVIGVLLALSISLAVSLATRDPMDARGPIESWLRDGLGGRAVVAMVFALVVWIRGIAAGRARLTREDVEGSFRGGVIALAVLFVLNTLLSPANAAPVGALVVATLVVLFAGLIGMPLARILDLSASEQRRQGTGLRVSRHWLGMIAGTIGILLVVAVLLAAVVTFERLDRLLGPVVSLIETALGFVVYLIAVPLGLLVQLLVDVLQSLLRPRAARVQILNSGISWLDQLKAQAATDHGPSVLLVLFVRGAVIASIIAVAVWLIARAVARYADTGEDDGVDEARDFVLSWEALAIAIRSWLARLLRRNFLPGPRPAILTDQPTVIRGDPLDPREIYRELLRLGARLGRGRLSPETPREYQGQVARLTPLGASESDLSSITAVYSEYRYSEKPPNPSSVLEARAALERLQEIGHRDVTDEQRPKELPESPV